MFLKSSQSSYGYGNLWYTNLFARFEYNIEYVYMAMKVMIFFIENYCISKKY